jgi:hypothetical protein
MVAPRTPDITPALELASSASFRGSSETVVPAPARRFGPPLRGGAAVAPPPTPTPFERLAAWMSRAA